MSNPQSSLPGLTPAHFELKYGDSLLRPSPFIAFTQTIERDDNQDRLKVVNQRTLTGTILTSGWGYHQVYAKQQELLSAFSVDNLELTIRATAFHPCLASGTYIASGIYPRVVSIEIPADLQFLKLDYTIVLEDEVSASGAPTNVNNFSNSWQFTENDGECSVDITHSVSAQGINTSLSGLPSNAITNARSAVRAVLGLVHLPSGFPYYVQPASGSNVGFYELTTTREESIDTESASYGITERFKLVSGLYPFIDERNATFSVDNNEIITVTIAGTVRGLGRTNDGAAAGPSQSSGGTGFANALSGFNNRVRPLIPTDALLIYNRYLGSGVLVTSSPLNYSISQSPCLGTIAYSYTFTDDPAANLPSGIIEMSSSVQRTDPVVFVASHSIPYRTLGSILQAICTTQDGTYAVTASVRAKDTGNRLLNTNRAIEVLENEINRLIPNVANYIDLKLTGRNFSYDDRTRSAQATYTWLFTESISSVPSDSGPITLSRIS